MKLLKNIANAFGKKKNPEEIRREAELNYRAQMRAFQRYDTELGKTVDKFKKIAVESEGKGQHANALRAARFVRQIQKTQDKVASVCQHFEMLHVMSGVGDVMVRFMDTCKTLGCDLSQQIDVEALGSGELSLEAGLSKLEFMSDKMEQAFQTIEDSLSSFTDDGVYATPEDEALLADLLGVEKPEAEPQPTAVKEPAQQAPAAAVSSRIDALNREFESIKA